MSRTSKKKGLGKNSDGDLNTTDSFFYKFCLEDDKKLVKATEDVQGAPVMDSSHLKVWRKDAGVTTKEGDEVLIAGEMNPVPKVQPEEVVTESFGEIPSKGVVSDEAVAMGEAIQGGTLLDATLISLGTPMSCQYWL